jgi:hypothetical protein
MQKGPRKRHLAAEACTTTYPPTSERFRFLLGPPTYTVSIFLDIVYIIPFFKLWYEKIVLAISTEKLIDQFRIVGWLMVT